MDDLSSSQAGGHLQLELAAERADVLLAAERPGAARLGAYALDAPWRLPAAQARFFALALGAAVLVVGLRLLWLGSLQNDPYGDIEIVYSYARRIQAGEWPFEFVLSAGPLYGYATAPLLAVAGLSYFSLKLAAVSVSLGVLAATYALSRRLIDDYFALLAATIAGVSSWLLIWSRLGNSQIIVPLLTATALWLAVRVAQRSRTPDLVACAAVSALGLYAYPQSFVLPGVVLITLLCLRWAGQRVSWAQLGLFALVAAICALPFAWIVSRNPQNFISGYIGSKFITQASPLGALLRNLGSAALAFHIRGDSTFRNNPSGVPHLDVISGVLLLAGAIFWLLPARRRWCPLLLVPFVLLQLPSALVLGYPDEVPSASRTLGAAPIAYILVASGIWWLARAILAAGRLRLGLAVGALLLAAIVGLNAERYFGAYISGLPYHDASVNAEIAAYADRLPDQTQVYLVGCCWAADMPAAPFVELGLERVRSIHEIDPHALTCEQVQFLQQPAVLIWRFQEALPAPQLAACAQWLPPQLWLSPRGWPMFYAAPVRPALPALSAPSPGGAPGEQLASASVVLDGHTVGVRTSPFDMGQPSDLFDHSRDTLLRGRDANPLVIELSFTQPRALRSIGLDLATMPRFRVRVAATTPDGQALGAEREYRGLPNDPHIDLALADKAAQVSVVRLEIQDLSDRPGEGFHIHVRELQIEP